MCIYNYPTSSSRGLIFNLSIVALQLYSGAESVVDRAVEKSIQLESQVRILQRKVEVAEKGEGPETRETSIGERRK